VGGFGRVTVALCAATPTTIYTGLSGNPFRIYRSTDGMTFALRYTATSSIYNPWIGCDPINPSIVYLLSANFQRSTDGGATFAVTSADLHECQKFASDPVAPNVIYIGRDNGLFRSEDRGVTFTQIGGGIANVEFYDGALAATNPSLMIGGTQDNGTVRYDGSSTVWNEMLAGDGATVDIDPTNDGILYAMGQYASSIARSVDGGGSWTNIASGLPTGTVCFNLHFQVHPTTPTTLLASCRSLWRTTTPGAPWSTFLSIVAPPGTPPVNIVRSAVDPTVNLYYAGTDQGDLYAGPTGANWQRVFTHPANMGVTDIEIDRDNPETVYASFGGTGSGRLYRLRRSSPTPSTMTALDITSNLPTGLSVRTVAIDRMTPLTVYVGTNRGVYRGVSMNEGATWSWTDYNDGLPLANVSDVEVHPTTGVMRAATYGRSAYEVHTDWPIGTLTSATGVITLLRVHDVETGWGPPNDFLDVEVVIMLDTMPAHGFGFQLRPDLEETARRGMLDLLRDAFNHNWTVTIDYDINPGQTNGVIRRVWLTK